MGTRASVNARKAPAAEMSNFGNIFLSLVLFLEFKGHGSNDDAGRPRPRVENIYETVDSEPKYDEAINDGGYIDLARISTKEDGIYSTVYYTLPRPALSCESKVIVAAIDFGTTYSGFAFSTRQDQMKDASKIILYLWPHAGPMAVKAPTSVLFSPDGNFKAFGFEAEEFFNDESKEDLDKYYFFKNFKMILYNDKGISRHTQLKDITGVKSLPAIDVFSSVIRYFHILLMDKIMLQFSADGRISADDIFWVLTVPAIWGLKAKCFMREAAEMAGIKSDQLALALEPEAASLACRQIPTTVVTKDAGNKVVSTFKEGSKYLVLDLGGGTIDLTAHEIIERGGLKEIHQASGGKWGGTYINQKFIDFLAKLLGDDVIKRIKSQEPSDWLELIDNFEQKKCTYNFNRSENVIIRVPVSVIEVLKTKSLSGSSVFFKRDKLTLSPELFISFFEESLAMICKAVRDTLKSLSGVESILAVGGFAECNLVIQRLKKEFENYTVLVPEEPRLSVLKGAVMYGMDPYAIRTRICRYTYGIPTQRRFRDWQDPVEKKREEPDGKLYCDDIFEKHVERGETIILGKYREAKEYCTVRKDQKMVALELYASSDSNPTFVTDDSCYHVGMVEINLENDVNDGRVLVSLNVGGTEIEIQAKENATGKVSTALCNFLG